MQKSSLLAIIFVIVGLVVGLVFVLPSWEYIRDVKRPEQESKKKDLDNKREIENHLDELIAQYEGSKKDFERLSLAIPADSQLPELITQFGALIKKDGLVIKSIKFSDVVDQVVVNGVAKSIKTLAIDFSAEGGYRNFRNLLDDIEKNIRLMDVTAVSISNKEASTIMNATLNVYYLGRP